MLRKVRNKKIDLSKIIELFLILGIVLLGIIESAEAVDFQVLSQNVELTIHSEGTLEVWYYLDIKTTSESQGGIYLGIPHANIYDYGASSGGRMVKYSQEVVNGQDVLKVYFPTTAYKGDITDLKINFFVKDMVFVDTEGRVGVEFIPAWWEGGKVKVLRVKFFLPEGVTPEETGTKPTNATIREESGRTTVYWERENIDPRDFDCGVSFPKQYVTSVATKRPTYPTPTTTRKSPGSSFATIFVIIVISVIAFSVIGSFRKSQYKAPKMKIESLGINKNLDPAESAVLLEADPVRIVNIILFSLVKKGRIKILGWEPLQVEMIGQEEIKSLRCPNCGAPVPAEKFGEHLKCEYCSTEITISDKLNYYERDFLLQGFKGNKLDFEGVKIVLKNLAKEVESKMTGYDVIGTREHYRKKIDEYWANLKEASDEEKYRLFGRDMQWLMSDSKFEDRSKDTFRDVRVVYTPNYSWWFWYNLGRGSYRGGEFSRELNRGMRGVEKEVGTNREALKTSVSTPRLSSAAKSIAHAHKSCVCACASCACACACVSCACACASGGGF